MADVREIAEQIVNLTIKDASELLQLLEDEYNIKPAAAAAAVAMPGAVGGDGAVGEAPEEKTEFDVVLNGFGGNKIAVIKVVRSLTGAGLKEAKEMVDTAPSTLKEAASKDEAEDMKKQLEEAGAEVELK